MPKYAKCPRCELNYYDTEKQEYCDVCLTELKGNKLMFADLDLDDDEEQEGTELCPICHMNYISFGEKMCADCLNASAFDAEEAEQDIEEDEGWKEYVEDDSDDLIVDEAELDEEEREEDDEEGEFDGELDDDDFESEDVVSYEDYAEEDDEEDDEEDEDDDF